MMNKDEEVVDLLDPMLDVFGGADGGVAFAKLRHGFLTGLIEKRSLGTATELELSVLTMVGQFSRLCKEMLK